MCSFSNFAKKSRIVLLVVVVGVAELVLLCENRSLFVRVGTDYSFELLIENGTWGNMVQWLLLLLHVSTFLWEAPKMCRPKI